MVAMLSHVALLGLRHRRSARSACVNAGALCLSLYIVALLRVRHCRSAQSASPVQESASCRHRSDAEKMKRMKLRSKCLFKPVSHPLSHLINYSDMHLGLSCLLSS